MITVQVFYRQSGKPAVGKRVGISFKSLLRGVIHDYTDSNGEVHLNVDPGEGEIFVDGEKVWEGYLSGRTVVYI